MQQHNYITPDFSSIDQVQHATREILALSNVLTNFRNPSILFTSQTLAIMHVQRHYQHPFWDFVNTVELVPVVLLQRILFISHTFDFWKTVARLGSSTVSAMCPTFLYCIGQPELAAQLAKSLVCYALFSSLGKSMFRRRRPGTYEVVYSQPTTSMAAFPSRHTICMTILASFTPVKWPLISVMVVDRLLLGKHFISDCFVGYLIGEMSVWAGTHIESTSLIIAMLLVALRIWKSGAKTLAGTLPVIVAPPVECSPLLLPLLALKYMVMSKVKVDKKKPIEVMVVELLAASILVYSIYAISQVLPSEFTHSKSPAANHNLSHIADVLAF